jgi:hypothetical protein
MGYGDRLKNPDLLGKTPEGRTSYQDALNQVKGYIEWSLDFLSPEEIVGIINETYLSDARKHSFSSTEKRLQYLNLLAEHHEQSLEVIEQERQRNRQILFYELYSPEIIVSENRILHFATSNQPNDTR